MRNYSILLLLIFTLVSASSHAAQRKTVKIINHSDHPQSISIQTPKQAQDGYVKSWHTEHMYLNKSRQGIPSTDEKQVYMLKGLSNDLYNIKIFGWFTSSIYTYRAPGQSQGIVCSIEKDNWTLICVHTYQIC